MQITIFVLIPRVNSRAGVNLDFLRLAIVILDNQCILCTVSRHIDHTGFKHFNVALNLGNHAVNFVLVVDIACTNDMIRTIDIPIVGIGAIAIGQEVILCCVAFFGQFVNHKVMVFEFTFFEVSSECFLGGVFYQFRERICVLDQLSHELCKSLAVHIHQHINLVTQGIDLIDKLCIQALGQLCARYVCDQRAGVDSKF